MSAYLPTILNSKKFKLQKIDKGWNVFGIPPDSTDDDDMTFFLSLLQTQSTKQVAVDDDMTFFLSLLQTQSTKQVAGVEVIKQAKEGPADGSSSDTDNSD
ncbi:hypothetical protein THAOC_21015 [Thalassiosira oceanica]|uniref:Uncharacterized protein n=1 Tax=Thalassiosira oceanica TaxID=159749 RepID=K0S0I2_THAOC|nr:hypothetical protein THAOC_21015 [Thalassiosira oceanica]|eukprot:EJK58825.1 hypothetical protein THAOC_21015 [Thalassiosira oceanica]